MVLVCGGLCRGSGDGGDEWCGGGYFDDKIIKERCGGGFFVF